jgi:hypothetical protein
MTPMDPFEPRRGSLLRSVIHPKVLQKMKIAGKQRVLAAYAAAMLAIATGVLVAMARYPGGFDWSYSVISRLASLKHNPEGGAWICGGLLVGMVLLWPVANHLARGDSRGRPRFALSALRVGLIGGALLAIEGLFMVDLSGIARKGHEMLALVTLLGLYTGVLGIYVHRIRRGASIRPPLFVLVPLIAVGTSQFALYFDQRDLGWVDTSWREMGVPVWMSFAFWQWLAVAVLGAGLGHLTATSGTVTKAPEAAERTEENAGGVQSAPPAASANRGTRMSTASAGRPPGSRS